MPTGLPKQKLDIARWGRVERKLKDAAERAGIKLRDGDRDDGWRLSAFAEAVMRLSDEGGLQ